MGLQRDVGGEIVALGAQRQRLGQTRRAVVGSRDVANTAFLDQLCEGRERLLQRRLRIIAVGVVEVDALNPEPLQGPLNAAADHLAGEPGQLLRHADLGRDYEPLAVGARGQPAADDALRAAEAAGAVAAVDVGGVDEVAATLHVRVEDRKRALLVECPAEHVSPKTQREYVEVGVAETCDRPRVAGAGVAIRSD